MKPARILLVEDNHLNRELASDLLRVAGFEVVEAETGEVALAQAGLAVPDLILLDIRLPGMDGFEVMNRLRRYARLATVPVVALTAQAMEGDREIALVAGFRGYITKPINTRTFVQEVMSHLRSQPGPDGGGTQDQVHD